MDFVTLSTIDNEFSDTDFSSRAPGAETSLWCLRQFFVSIGEDGVASVMIPSGILQLSGRRICVCDVMEKTEI